MPAFTEPDYPGRLLDPTETNITEEVFRAAAARRRLELDGENPDPLDEQGHPFDGMETNVSLSLPSGVIVEREDGRLEIDPDLEAKYIYDNARLNPLARHIVTVASLRDTAENGGWRSVFARAELAITPIAGRSLVGGSEGPILGKDGLVDRVREVYPAKQ